MSEVCNSVHVMLASRFLVELCEPVQVHSIEMGNLELFSSVPESFLVQVSDR